MNIKELIKTKTFWLGISTIAGGVILCINKEYEKGIEGIIAGLAMIFVRDALTKKQ